METLCVECGAPAAYRRKRCDDCSEQRRARLAKDRVRRRTLDASPKRQASVHMIHKLTDKMRELGYSKALGMTFLKAACKRHRAHVEALRSLGCLRQAHSLESFFAEILAAPTEALRVELLTDDRDWIIRPAFQRYEQYVSPREI